MRNTKKIHLPAVLLGWLLFVMLTTCEKESSTPPYLSDEVILDLAEDALKYEAAGLLFELRLMGKMADQYLKDENPIPVCGRLFQERPAGESENQLFYYSGLKGFTLNCNTDSIIASIHISSNYRYGFNVNRPSNIQELFGQSSFTIEENGLDGSALVFDGNYTRYGVYVRPNGETEEFIQYSVSFFFEELLVDRSDFSIISGSGEYTFSAIDKYCYTCRSPEIWTFLTFDFLPDGMVKISVDGKSRMVNPMD